MTSATEYPIWCEPFTAGQHKQAHMAPYAGATAQASAVAAGQDAADAVAALFAAHYRPLVRVAMLLVEDLGTAEEVVQDSFAALYANWRRFKNSDNSEKASWYLRQCVLNRSRSVLRHRKVAKRKVLQPPPDTPSAEEGAITSLERDAVAAALQQLPVRQREALVLRYYAGLSETEIASAMGISRGAVKSHSFRGMSALRDLLGSWEMSQRLACLPGSGPGSNAWSRTAAGTTPTGTPLCPDSFGAP